MSTKFIEMVGRKFGKLTVLELSEYKGKKGRENYYIVKCECGSESYQILGTSLRRKTKPTLNCRSCGDKKKQKYGVKVKGTRLYKIWDGMKQRCNNENDKIYHRYGGRGIVICDEWIGEDGFNNFMKWANENGYSDDLTIDRIDNNGNYESNNCRWVDITVQANNKSNNKLIEYKGISKTMAQWADEYGIPYVTFVKRIDYGWDIERALLEEVSKRRRKNNV